MTELGIRLKEAREEKAMSLDDLQAATKIQKRYLTALEEGNYDIIPGSFYVRAFIKQYAEAVGLDSDQLFEEFKKDIPNTYHDDVSEKLSGMKSQRELPKPASKALEVLPTILVIAGVLVVIAIIYVVVQLTMNKSNDQSDAASKKAVTQSESKYEIPKDSTLKDNKKSSSETDSKKDTKTSSAKKDDEKKSDSGKLSIKATGTEGSATTYEVSGADKIELELAASDSAWIRVRDENSSSLKEGTLKKDETYKKDITDQKQVDIRTGYAPNLKIKINGEVLSYELDPKDVMAQTITIVNKKEEKSS
ncbi:helix-turn-helix domain-containing protein [Bacillus atrophaeus]|uniref:cell shape determination protein RodZ n=1 Tax=Bacillus atrophaeus TaxID=1452 RepID=UPI00228145BB|nr:RodZ family helix-turn-helix domain-containing protein [Bacillus atrophaeus]MEC0838600.1 helix-turn-helix domain-containing protein [Bacillus atrophaeus]MEC0847543.1 helix-turn-helix domain-containing protein [Bacillus atrophaeus]MEC0848590.1 helix-turn-helix domain-containing protein [Bacillus atrophaeus]MEC0866984.1 helix-turn-helix domain-containing protein [Bacillus atrophaeus]MEC0894059.1 helix-turn-helix domain-containing protein [Bacillus atrophaeus]